VSLNAISPGPGCDHGIHRSGQKKLQREIAGLHSALTADILERFLQT
jgi:hypothetical protein